jgi:quercetin dioxygenase-like cupin family protein
MTIEKAMSIAKIDGLKVHRHEDLVSLPIGVRFAQEIVAYETDHVQVGKLWIKKFILPTVGAGVVQHRHEFDHVTLVAKGNVKVISYEGEAEKVAQYSEGDAIVIEKGRNHFVVALSPGATVYCVHALDEE